MKRSGIVWGVIPLAADVQLQIEDGRVIVCDMTGARGEGADVREAVAALQARIEARVGKLSDLGGIAEELEV